MSDVRASVLGTRQEMMRAAVSKKAVPKPIVQRGKTQGGYVKILAYGHSGTGKTYAIKGFVENGLRVVVISTDLGGNGLASVFNALEAENKAGLCDNIVNLEFADYDSLYKFLVDPESVWPEFFSFDPDVLVWDGFTGFQQIQVTEKVLDLQPLGRNSSEAREEGLWAEQQDWGMIRNATLRGLSKFLNLHNWRTGKQISKYVTCLESKPSPDKITNEVVRAPYLQGSAQALIGPAFDIIIETRAVKAKNSPASASDANDKDSGIVYKYYCVGHDMLVAKSRGFDLAAVEDADMGRLWRDKIAPKIGAKHNRPA